MHTLELTIQRQHEGRWPVVAEYRRGVGTLPERTESRIVLDPTNLEAVAWEDRARYGELLGEALWTRAVWGAFERAWSATTAAGERLRVLLNVEAPALRALHWERLRAPLGAGEHWDFLSRTQQCYFSLYSPSLARGTFPAIGRRNLRALVVVANPQESNPYHLARFDAQETVRSIRATLGDIPHDILATSEVAERVGPPTAQAIAVHLTAQPCTLLHFVAHGWFNGTDTVLYLTDEAGVVQPTRAAALVDQLAALRQVPHFIFLGTCESATPDAARAGALGSVAQQLVRHLGIPAVLAMTEKVSIPTAEAVACAFYTRLREHGEADRALAEAAVALRDRHDLTVPALYSRLEGRPLFSDTLDRPLTAQEIADGMERLAMLVVERAPILQEAVGEHAATLRGMLGAGYDNLSAAAQRVWDDALAALNRIGEEVLDLTFRALALGKEPPAYDVRAPFLGLKAFEEEDKKFFFGRDLLVEELLARLRVHTFLPVLGPSGSGKSSLVRAGMLPRLRRSETSFRVGLLTPGSTPLVHLEAALADDPTLLIVDQFEEIFTLTPDEGTRRAVFDRLLDLTEQIPVIVTMRADFWGEVASYPRLKAAMQAHQELIGPMSTHELRAAMEQQAGVVGLRFEADLAHTIMADVQGEPGAMPLLQHALREVWARRHGRWLLAKEYRAIGEGDVSGVKGAIARTAETIYVSLSEDERARMRDIFIRLTRLEDSGLSGEEARDTRRRVALHDLVPEGSDPMTTRRLVQRLADERLVVTSRNPATVEVTHEALIRHWPRLRHWLSKDRLNIRLRETISQQARRWVEGGEADELLPRWNSELEAALQLTELNRLERRYLDACVELREREREAENRRRAELEAALTRAERQARLARAEHLATQAQMLFERGEDPSGSLPLLLAQAAVETTLAVEGDVLASADAVLRQVVLWGTQWRRTYRYSGRNVRFWDAAISPDGRYIIAVGSDELIVIWDLETGVERRRYRRPNVTSLAFSPDGDLVITGSTNGTAMIWDFETGRDLQQLVGHTKGVWSVAYSPDAQQVATGSWDGTAILWNVNSGKQEHILSGHENYVLSVSYSGDGKLLATASKDRTARLWDTREGVERQKFLGHTRTVSAAACSPDGTHVLTGGVDTTVRLWNAATGQMLHQLLGHTGYVLSTAFSPDGKFALTAGTDNTARLWDVAAGQEVLLLHGHSNDINKAVFDSTGKLIATAGKEGTVRLWKSTPQSEEFVLRGHGDAVFSTRFTTDGESVLSASRDGTARLWRRETRDIAREFQVERGSLFSADIDDGGTVVVTGGSDGIVRLWQVTSGKELAHLSGHEGQVWSVVFSPDGKQVVSAGSDRTARLWAVDDAQEVRVLEGHPKAVRVARFDASGGLVATGCDDGGIRLFDATSGEELAALRGHAEPVLDLAFRPDGQHLGSVGSDGKVLLWDLHTQSIARAFHGHSGNVFSIAFSPDGKQMVTAGKDATARTWRVASAEELRRFDGSDYMLSAAFHSDGQTVVTGSKDGTVRLWPSTEALLDLSRQMVQREPPTFTEEEKKRFGRSHQ